MHPCKHTFTYSCLHLFPCKFSLYFYVGETSVEYNTFIQFYDKLTTVFHDKNYLSHFVPAGIISPNDVHHMSNLPDNDRATCLLKKISAPLECGEKQSFYKMLEIMRDHGNLFAKQLAENMSLFVRGVNPVVRNETSSIAIEGIHIYK